MDVQVMRAVDDPNLVKCPRCLRWHGVRFNTNWPVEPNVPPERQVICDRCTSVLLSDHPNHDVCVAIRLNSSWQKTTKPWLNDNNK